MKKRLRVSEWPTLFDITPLAKIILGFVPKMQVRQWVRKSSGTEQRDICLWIAKEDIDIEIHKAIFAADNALCVQYLPTSFSNTSSFQLYPAPNLLSQLPFHEEFVHEKAPLCNLQVLSTHKEWTQTMAIALIQHGFASQTNEWLSWLLDFVGQKVEIGIQFGPHFNLEFWNMRKPVLNRCTIDTACPDFLASMPVDVFCSIPESSDQKKYGADFFFVTCIHNSNWELASYLYKEDCALDLDRQFHRCIGARIHKSPDVFERIVSDDSEFVCFEKWNVRTNKRGSNNACLNDALRFVNQPIAIQKSHATLKDVLCTWIAKLFLQVGMEELNCIFECACVLGHYYTVLAIWNFVTKQQQHHLQTKIAVCRVCENVELLEFAWSVIGDDIRRNALLWIRSAYNNNNGVVWKFLVDKQLLKDQLLFDPEVEIVYPCLFPSDSMCIAQSLGRKSVTLLATVWDMQDMQSSNNVDVILNDAIEADNTAVLQFLNEHNATVSQRVLCRRLLTLCQLGLANLCSRIDPYDILVARLQCYAVVASNAREALWRVAPLQSAIYFVSNTDLSFDMCVFLLEKQVISTQECIDTLKNKPNPDVTLINDIDAYTYCDADAEQHF